MYRRGKWFAAMLLLLMLALVGCSSGGGGDQKSSAGDPVKGKELFAGTCAACHGPDAKGLPNLGKDLTTSTFVKSQSDQQLLEFIKKGRAPGEPGNTTGVAMPPKGGNPAMTDKDMTDVITFIRSINR